MNSVEEWKQSSKPQYIWIGFWKTEHTQDQQNGVHMDKKIASLEQVAYMASNWSRFTKH